MAGPLLLRLQHEVFIAQSELAAPTEADAPAHRITDRHVQRLEEDTDRLGATLEPLRHFVLPRGSRAAAEVHVARAVARRAERELWSLNDVEPVSPALLRWANRMSGLLFGIALSLNRAAGLPETAPDYTT